MKFKLDYEKWICGTPENNEDKECYHGKGSTRLLNSEGFMCCLGQFCQQLGAKDDDLLYAYEPIDINLNKHFKYVNEHGFDRNWASNAIDINDNEESMIYEKIAFIKRLLEKHNHELELLNFPEEILCRAQEMELRLKQESSK